MMEKFLTPSEAAEIIGVTTRMVQRLCQTGQLPNQRVGERYIITEAAARAYKPDRRGPKGARPAQHG